MACGLIHDVEMKFPTERNELEELVLNQRKALRNLKDIIDDLYPYEELDKWTLGELNKEVERGLEE